MAKEVKHSHAWGHSDYELVKDISEREGWRLVGEVNKSPAHSNRPHIVMTFEREVPEASESR